VGGGVIEAVVEAAVVGGVLVAAVGAGFVGEGVMVAEPACEAGGPFGSLPSSPSSSGSLVAQEAALVVVALAVTSHPTARDELVVVQLEEPEFIEVQDTHNSVTVDLEHDVDEGEGSD